MSKMLWLRLVWVMLIAWFGDDVVPPQPVPMALPPVVAPAVPPIRPSIPDGRKVSGTATAVHDGDTITMVAAGLKYQVRLNGIDAPELAQPYGPEARKALAALVLWKKVTVLSMGVDKYGRTIGNIYSGRSQKGRGATINAQMVQDGWAWRYRQYSNSWALMSHEANAQAHKLGLWVNTEKPEPPWVFRRKKPAVISPPK